MKRFIYIIVCLLAVACHKEPLSRGTEDCIEFSVITPDVTVTKAEVTSTGVDNNTDKVYVYGSISNGTTSTALFSAPGVSKLTHDKKIWKPAETKNWNDQSYYEFYGYAYNQRANVVSTLNNNDNNGQLKIVASDYGRHINIYQPTSVTWAQSSGIDQSGTIDYLLSYKVTVTPTTVHPLVPLQLEHAMAKVEIDVKIAESMYSTEQCYVGDLAIEVSNIIGSADLVCLTPKQYGAAGTNSWERELDASRSCTYKVTGITTGEDNKDESTATPKDPDMSFMAIPVDKAEMSAYKLKVTYTSSASGQSTQYEKEFNLADFTPKGWVSGHRVKYVLTVDNSIHLTGTILDFEEVDYIEGTILPDIIEGTGNSTSQS